MCAFVPGDRKSVTITVLIADDQAVVRDIFRFLLERAGDMEIVATASNGRDAVELTTSYSPDVVVMDVSMPLMDGIEATRQIHAKDPKARVLMVSLHDNANYIRSSVQAGALGYVLKDTVGDELVKAVRSIHQHQQYFSQRIAVVAQRFLSDTGKTDPVSEVDSPPPA